MLILRYRFSQIVFLIFITVLCTFAIPVSAADTNINLAFNDLPSAQGWTLNSNLNEASIFSVNGSSLFQNTVGTGYEGNAYSINNIVDTSAPFTISVTVRILNYEVQSAGNPFGFTIGVMTGNEVYDVGIAPNNILSTSSEESGLHHVWSSTIDVSQFHTYRIEATPGEDLELFIDNVSYGTVGPRVYPFPNRIYIGDGTAGANANAEVTAFSFYQDTDQSACSINAPASVNEGTSFTATVECEDVDNVYGFQLGTSASGDVSTSASSYVPGSFVTDAGSDYLSASNSLSNYSVSRRSPVTAASGSFTLGSLDFMANSGLSANGSATLTIDSLLLGDINGGAITVPIVNSTSVTIVDLLTLNLTVASDGTVQQLRDVTASVDAESRGPQTAAGTSLILNFTDVISTPTPLLTADMRSHLQCSGSLNLTTSITNQTIHLKAGDVVLNAADVTASINLFDAVTIGLAFGSAGSAEEDVNGDGTVNIFDLIHVGRNYGAITGLCS
jgi:hypothetical protein